MKHVSILPLYDATINSIDSTYQLFSRVNDFMRYQQRPLCYEVAIVGTHKNAELSNGRYTISVDKTIDEVAKTDLIVLPLLCGNFRKAIEVNTVYTDWIMAQQPQAEIACLCTGSFYLASTGLLDGKQCAVHWAALQEFKALFPNVKTTADQVITDENGIYTCGGGYAYLNLLLHIIGKQVGRETAVLASKMFEIDLERTSQAPFTILVGQKGHGDAGVLQVQEWIERHPTETYSVEFICDQFSLGRRTFERHFKKHTGNSIVEYIQRVKVEFAKKGLEQGRKTINEIIYETGYSDIDAFRKVFKKHTSLSPLEYRKKYTAQ